MAQGKSKQNMIDRIVSDLGQRTDLAATAIPTAIDDAVEIYCKQRFRWNELQPLSPFVFNTVQGVSYYDSVAVPNIDNLYKVDFLNYLLGSTTEKMQRVMPEEIYLALQNGTEAGPPASWAYDGQSIVMYPRPNQAYQITVGGFMRVPGPGADLTVTTNVWMNQAERLIRSRAKYEIALHVTRNKDMIAMMSPDTGSGGACERYFDELLGETNKIKATSRIRAMRW